MRKREQVELLTEPPDPKDMRYTLKGLTADHLTAMYWALREYASNHPGHTNDSRLMQLLWSGEA